MNEVTCPIWVTVRDLMNPKRTYRQVCGLPATEYQVQGKSFQARQALCQKHRSAAELEGFRLIEISTGDTQQCKTSA